MLHNQKYFSGDNYEAIYTQILDALFQNPEFVVNSDKPYREIQGLTFTLGDPLDRLVWNSARDANYEFAMKMFIWVLNGCDDFAYVSSNPNAQKFIDIGTASERATATFNTAYGPRIARQLPAIIEELRRDPSSRRATINILQEGDKQLLGQNTKTEFPCVETLTFSIRQTGIFDRALHLHANLRSNNMFTTVVYDVFVHTMLQEYVYNVLRKSDYDNLYLGNYTHHCTSAHVFESDLERIDDTLRCTSAAMTRVYPKESA